MRRYFDGRQRLKNNGTEIFRKLSLSSILSIALVPPALSYSPLSLFLFRLHSGRIDQSIQETALS